MSPETYNLCEAVFDMAENWFVISERRDPKPEDSRERVSLTLKWAEQFEQKFHSEDWSGLDYFDEVDAFFVGKYEEWMTNGDHDTSRMVRVTSGPR